jgi:serine/threonine-protein kinase
LHNLEDKDILRPMPPVESEGQAVRAQLERVLGSPGFASNERLSRFLRFIVERHLEERDHDLKETVIAIEVFGRRPDYNPKHDAIVRTEAGRLRARLTEYYIGVGTDDELVIELPKGGYVPRFRQVEAARETAAPLHAQREHRLGTRLWLVVALGGLAAALAAAILGWWWLQRKSVPITIAVLPLENLSQDSSNDYFADGLTDELIRHLSIIDGLAVRSRTSSFAFKGKPRKVQDVGKQLAADYILEGSVLRAPQQLRINAQLVRVRDDFLLWSGEFERELTDVFAIQEEISRNIVNSLRLQLGRGRRRYETSLEAYDLYLRARALQRDIADPGKVIDQFKGAIARDPSFAPAYAGLATAYALRAAIAGIPDEIASMRAAAEKAIQLDPLLAEAHAALGMAHAHDARWRESEMSFRRAIELDPSRATSYGHFAFSFLLPMGRIEEALDQVRIAEKNDPLSTRVRLQLGSLLISAGRYEEAAGYCRKLPDDLPVKSLCLGEVLLGQGRTADFIQIFLRSKVPTYVGYAYARSGRRQEAEKMAVELSRPSQQAFIFAGLGDKERTLEALDRMAALGPVPLALQLTSPAYSLLRGDPRLKALRKKAGLPE